MAAKGEGRGWRPGGGSGPVRRGAKPEWIPDAEKPKSRTRRYKQIALGVLALALIGAFVVLAYLLIPPSPPVLLVIMTDPAEDVLDLNAPVDPYGWLSGKDLVKWSERYSKDAPNEKKKHVPTTSNGSGELKNNNTVEDLAKWAAGKAHASTKPSETAIIYFGLHTGADKDGPFLYANKGRHFHVKPLLKSLYEEMGRTKVLVLFDPGRQLPDPARGQLNDGFVDGVKALTDEIASYGNLTVILGCDSGERAWESEELQRTAFAHAVIQGLSGKAHPREGNTNTITAADLYDYVKEATEKWTLRNRPSVQHPVMIPASEAGQQQAAATKLALHHDLEDEPLPKLDDPILKLATQWEEYGKLAGGSGPDPEVYSPRRWRRYRELLLRYEFLMRSGEPRSQAALEGALPREAAEIRKALKAQVIDKSAMASNSMWQAAGRQPAADAVSELRGPGDLYLNKPTKELLNKPTKELQEFTDKFQTLPGDRIAYSKDLIDTALKAPGDGFAKRAELLHVLWNDLPVRPSDVQLFLMLDQFYHKLVKEPLPEEVDPKGSLKLWQQAIQVRRKAEDAAIGPTAVGHPYSEVIWRCVQADVIEADSHRRKAEDALFAMAGSRERAEAWTHFDDAMKQYQRAADKATQVRAALKLRDSVMADLPFLGRWSVFEGEDKLSVNVKDLWRDAHALAGALDALPADSPAGLPAIDEKYSNLREATDTLAKGQEKLLRDFNARLQVESEKTDKDHDVWLERERLLAVPPLRDSKSLDGLAIRRGLIKRNRETTAYFINPQTDVNTKSDEQVNRSNAKKERERERARPRALGFLGMHELGKDLIDKQAAASDTNVSWGSVKDELNKINVGAKWEEEDAARAGEWIGRHYRSLADSADPVATDPLAVEAERFSRVALSFNHRDGDEPAEVLRKFRWQKMFAAQALRTVQDHWYDGDLAYYQTIAKAFIDDANELTPQDPTRVADKKPGHDLKTLLALPEAKFEEFEKLRNADPLDVKATAGDARWTTEAKKDVGFTLSAKALPDDARPVVWGEFVTPKDSKVDFNPGIDSRKILPVRSGVTALPLTLVAETAMSLELRMTIQRSAFFRGQYVPKESNLVLSRMPDLVYTHARPQPGDPLHPPQVAFVGPNDIDLGAVTIIIDYSPSMTNKPKSDPVNGEPRIKRAMAALREVLSSLPDGTILTVRGFGVAPVNMDDRPHRETFESSNTKGTYDRQLYKGKVSWKAIPNNLNQLMDTLKNVPPGDEYRNSPVVRTMLHSAREDFKDLKDHQTKVLVVLTDGADNSTTDYGKLTKALADEFKKDQKITVRMLLIEDEDSSQEDKDETKKFATLFDPTLKGFDPPGSILVEKTVKLGEELTKLLRPRVRLKRAGIELPEHLLSTRAEAPEWSKLAGVGEYEAWVGQKPLKNKLQTLEFESADALLVRLSRPDMLVGTREGVQFERVVWGREGEFGRQLRLNNRQQELTEQHWLLSAVMHRVAINDSKKGRFIFDLRAAVENVEPVRLKPVDGQVLKQVAPDFVWWELTPATKLNESAPIYIWREYGHPAPVWRVRRWDWTDKDNGLPKSTLRGWLPQQLKLPAPEQTTILREVTTGTWSGELRDRQKWTAKFGWEQHAFVTNPDSEEPIKPKLALVVRVYLDDPKKAPKLHDKPAPLFVQVAGTQIEEHRFFREAGAYTGYFHFGDSTAADPAANREVKLYSAIDLTKPGVGVEFELPLPKPDDQGADSVWKNNEGLAPKLPQ